MQGKFATPRTGEKFALSMWLEEHVRGSVSPFLGYVNVSYVARSRRPREDSHEEHVRAIEESVTIWM